MPNDLKNKALQYLVKREYSRFELKNKLRGFAEFEEEVDVVLNELEQGGYLSDERFRDQWLSAKQNRFGAKKIIYDLQQKGVAVDLIEQVSDHLHLQELENIRLVWEKKFAVLPTSYQEKIKQIKFLQGRGFSLKVILELLGKDIEG